MSLTHKLCLTDVKTQMLSIYSEMITTVTCKFIEDCVVGEGASRKQSIGLSQWSVPAL